MDRLMPVKPEGLLVLDNQQGQGLKGKTEVGESVPGQWLLDCVDAGPAKHNAEY
jgi:hypothetical protein